MAAGINPEGALQSLVELPAVLKTSLWCGLLVCSIEVPSKASDTDLQYTWCWVLWEIVSKEKNYHLIHTHRPTAKHIKSL